MIVWSLSLSPVGVGQGFKVLLSSLIADRGFSVTYDLLQSPYIIHSGWYQSSSFMHVTLHDLLVFLIIVVIAFKLLIPCLWRWALLIQPLLLKDSLPINLHLLPLRTTLSLLNILDSSNEQHVWIRVEEQVTLREAVEAASCRRLSLLQEAFILNDYLEWLQIQPREESLFGWVKVRGLEKSRDHVCMGCCRGFVQVLDSWVFSDMTAG